MAIYDNISIGSSQFLKHWTLSELDTVKSFLQMIFVLTQICHHTLSFECASIFQCAWKLIGNNVGIRESPVENTPEIIMKDGTSGSLHTD